MITFQNLPVQTHESWFFVPEPLKSTMMVYLKKAGIPYKSVLWKNMPIEKKQEQNLCATRYQQAGYINTTCIGALITHVDPNILFQKSLLFFGDTIDPDYQKEENAYEKKAHETYETCYKDWLKPGQIPVNSGK